ncbi:hypothetical protein IWX90DRAFT_380141 [Phyllosticta citrichinensis]|uniref:Uncharacterized protein n=1 Tax=Phyllosticta citrichinensis TaxID=1130410 RepID=A0ABR1Y4S4_9PEZI
MEAQGQSVQKTIRQSPPVDLTKPYDAAWVKGKHIVITGGASGFGAAFVQRWASQGASIVIGDIDAEAGEQLVQELRKELGNTNAWFVRCDVTKWQDQVQLFKEAVRLSPHGGIDCVVANAGIAGNDIMQTPGDLSADEPPPPNFKVVDVNLYGVLYTTHLACYWLPRNPGSSPSSPQTDAAKTVRDRHLLLVGSVASLAGIAVQPQYGAAKHAVLGLFRSIRISSFMQGIRVNMLCPYFVATPILIRPAKIMLAGAGLGRVADVVEAGTRFAADASICGRALVIGPPAKAVRAEDGQLVPSLTHEGDGEETGVWECYADDFAAVDTWTRRWVGLLGYIESARGWIGWAKDMAASYWAPTEHKQNKKTA